jgi:2-polyprenyl-6-methoxyphenol hydroxylase-like FAD-dependent oxidoreductase
MVRPRIAIIGAGPGGLTLARVLHLNKFDVSVFERETFSSARPQGGSLDMHAESGQHAIECCGLTAEFRRIARYDDQESRIYNKHGELVFAAGAWDAIQDTFSEEGLAHTLEFMRQQHA